MIKFPNMRIASPSNSTRPSNVLVACSHQFHQSNALLARISLAQHVTKSPKNAFHATQLVLDQWKIRFFYQSWTSSFSSAIDALQMGHWKPTTKLRWTCTRIQFLNVPQRSTDASARKVKKKDSPCLTKRLSATWRKIVVWLESNATSARITKLWKKHRSLEMSSKLTNATPTFVFYKRSWKLIKNFKLLKLSRFRTNKNCSYENLKLTFIYFCKIFNYIIYKFRIQNKEE